MFFGCEGEVKKTVIIIAYDYCEYPLHFYKDTHTYTKMQKMLLIMSLIHDNNDNVIHSYSVSRSFIRDDYADDYC